MLRSSSVTQKKELGKSNPSLPPNPITSLFLSDQQLSELYNFFIVIFMLVALGHFRM